MPEAIADPRLARAMADAVQHVALYRRHWGGPPAGAVSRQARTVDKAILQATRLDDRLRSGHGSRVLTSELSSGSSGEPLTVYSDRAALWARRCAFLRAMIHCGYRPGQRLLLLTSRRGARDSRWTRWHYASIGADSALLARRAADLGPRVLYGPLTTLELLAEHVAEQRSRLPSLRLVISTAEQLTDERRRTLERGFGVPVADFYGMTEFGLVAYRPPGHRSYVAARSSLVFEFADVPHDRAVEQLVISDLAERTCPLLRYATGDLVRRDRTRVDRPIIEFAGRSFDCIQLPNGERISPYRFDVALEHLPDLKAFEVVQQPDLSIDVTIDVPAAVAERTRRAIAERLSALLGKAMTLRIATGAIRRNHAIKFRPIRSLARSQP